ncbi:MAG: transglutaminaseTgpA domain-containing protein, partial [Microthrixaceae bacterium]
TTRPQLSDRVVMTVSSPVASFWRSEVFDQWDGTRWTRQVPPGGSLITDGIITPSTEDLAGANGDAVDTEVRIEAGYATALPTAPSAVGVDAPGHQLAQRPDGTVVAVGKPLGRGATYSVTSRRFPLDETLLAELGAQRVPEGILERYARPPVATPRTVQLAESVTAGLGDNFTRIVALQDWMGENTTYDIEAPLSPSGVDVVDSFLFESRVGWCEQIASSLVVMARSVGIPARLATGYAPGEWDSINGRFIVREQDAHSWAEVWFPEVGWVPFDPTADVPLSGSPTAAMSAGADRFSDVVATALLAVGLAALFGRGALDSVAVVVTSVRRRLRERAERRRRWDIAEEHAIDTEGASSLGRDRLPGETLTNFAAEALLVGADPALAERAAAVETHRYGPPGSSGAVATR